MNTNGSIRELDLRRDLEGLGELVEIAFSGDLEATGADISEQIQAIQRLVPLLSFLGRVSGDFRHLLDGFVYEDRGRIIASVMMQRKGGGGKRWEIGTVATHPDYRRRGLARQLVTRALEYVEDLGGEVCVLEVRSDNPAAYDLYRSLGFAHYDSTVHLKLGNPVAIQAQLADGYKVLPLALGELERVYDLALRETPLEVQDIMPVERKQYCVSGLRRRLVPLLERLQRRDSYRWGVWQGDELAGYVRLKAQHSPKVPHEMQMMIDPSHQGALGEPLLALALKTLQDYPPQNLLVSIRAAHAALVDTLRRYGFVEITTAHELACWLDRPAEVAA